MQNQKRNLSPTLYFLVISGLTDFVYLIVGAILIAIISISQWKSMVLLLILFMLWKGVVVGIFVRLASSRVHNKDLWVKYIGRYYGSFFGLIIGALLGGEISIMLKLEYVIGFIIGAFALYYVGRRIGSIVSGAIAGQVDKVLIFPLPAEPENIVVQKYGGKISQVAYFIFYLGPFLWVIIGLLLIYLGIPIGYISEYRTIARIGVILISISTLIYPWKMRKRWLVDYGTKTSSPEPIVYFLGLVFSLISSLYGLTLFITVGTSIYELCAYSAVSEMAMIIWGMKNRAY